MRFVPLDAENGRFSAVIDDLRFRFHKWDAYLNGSLRVLPAALVLSPEEHAGAVDCCVTISRALATIEATVREESGLMDRLAIPGAVQAIIRAEAATARQIARYDLIPTAYGWMLPEFNEDAPGGFNEAIAANSLFAGLLRNGTVPGDFAQAFLDALPDGATAGVVYATGYAEDLQHVLILADLLRDRGIDVVLASPEHLTCGRFGKPRLMGVPVDWIFRFFPGEWFVYLNDLRAWQRAVARVPVVNPLSRLIRQSKGLFALWRTERLLDDAATNLLNQHTPHTTFFDPADIPEYLARREDWVLKKAYGRMGDAVLIGRLCPPQVWEKALAEAAGKAGEYIAQHAFAPLAAPDGDRTLYPALGPYLIDGAFAGYYSRADESGFTTHEAYYAVTAVDAS